jgi:hypothetical protein
MSSEWEASDLATKSQELAQLHEQMAKDAVKN